MIGIHDTLARCRTIRSAARCGKNFTEERKKYRYIQLQYGKAEKIRLFRAFNCKSMTLGKKNARLYIYIYTPASRDIVDCCYKLLVVAQSMRNCVVPDAKAF